MLSDSMIAIAKDLIDQFGDTIKLSKVVSTGYNPVTHKNDETITNITTKGVKESVASNEVVPGVINITDSKITLYEEIKDIDSSWLIDDCNIIHVNKIGFQDKLVVYDVFVRCIK